MSESFKNALQEIKELSESKMDDYLENESLIGPLMKKYYILCQYENDTTINDMKLYVLKELKDVLNKTYL